MCGIAGIFHYGSDAPVDAELLDRMTDALAHRGPDGRGTFLDGPIGLGHRRLAILDPTPRGAQPMASNSGRTLITFNGEIYNFRELRRELEQRGRAFRTNCDTEVILEAWEEWGANCVRRLDGIYAFGLWDAKERALHLVRDRFGVKPLYVHDDGRTLQFASEIKALEVPLSPDWNGLRAVLELGYAAAPFTCFRGVRQLEPATLLTVSAGAATTTPTFPRDARASSTGGDFDDVLDRAVSMQMVSDVPIGAFLSGGLDSTRIVSAMGPHARAFTVGFTSRAFDESEVARETARRLGLEHEVVQVELDLAETALRVSRSFDDPFADSSALAVDHLCRATAQHVKVALSGDGADELLGGYATHTLAPFAGAVRLARPLLHAARLLPIGDHPYAPRAVAERMRKAGGEPRARAHASWRRYFFDDDEASLLTPDALHELREAHDPIDAYAREYRGETSLRAALNADLHFYLHNDMLVKVDRMSMAHSLEVRVPMLAHDVVDLARSLPDRMRRRKRVLRESVARRMPWFDAKAPKRGFLVPIAAGFRGELATLLRDHLTNDLFDARAVEMLLRNHERRKTDASFQLYATLMVQLWWKRFFA